MEDGIAENRCCADCACYRNCMTQFFYNGGDMVCDDWKPRESGEERYREWLEWKRWKSQTG
jgi:hypothetical protein